MASGDVRLAWLAPGRVGRTLRALLAGALRRVPVRAGLVRDRLAPSVPSSGSSRLARLGRGDGEWWFDRARVAKSGVVYSFGVGQDLSFERDLLAVFKHLTVRTFDPTPVAVRWMRSQRLPERLSYHAVGVSDHDGTEDFSLPEGHEASFSTLPYVGEAQKCTCPVRRLGTLLSELGDERITLLKMDIEGAEYKVLDDAAPELWRVGQILVEFHDRLLAPGEEGSRRSLERMEEAGFRVVHVSRRGYEVTLVNQRQSGNGPDGS